MRIERSITTVSWIPSDLLEGMGKVATRMKMAHHDPPPPDPLGSDIPAAIEELRVNDRFRFANQLRAYIEVDGAGTITDFGYCGGGVIGATTVGLGVGSITVPAVQLNDLQAEPEVSGSSVKFTQTVGGRTGAPMPRAVKHPPFIQYFAPTVWTTLELTIHADGTHEAAMIGASGFPRHWVFDHSGALAAKSSVAEYKKWMNNSFGRRTPWGDEDSPAMVTAVETQLERQLQEGIMRGGAKPDIRRIKEGKNARRAGLRVERAVPVAQRCAGGGGRRRAVGRGRPGRRAGRACGARRWRANLDAASRHRVQGRRGTARPDRSRQAG